MAAIHTKWTVDLGPPKEFMTLTTECGEEVTRQCTTTHDRAVEAAMQTFPPVEGEPVTTWTTPP